MPLLLTDKTGKLISYFSDTVRLGGSTPRSCIQRRSWLAVDTIGQGHSGGRGARLAAGLDSDVHSHCSVTHCSCGYPWG